MFYKGNGFIVGLVSFPSKSLEKKRERERERERECRLLTLEEDIVCNLGSKHDMRLWFAVENFFLSPIQKKVYGKNGSVWHMLTFRLPK